MKVRDLMTKEVSFANPNTPISQIATQMKNLDVGSIPVCDSNQRAVGIVTDRDIVLRSVSNGNINASAQDVMSGQLIYATPDMHAHEAANIMAQNQIRRLPVVENGKLVGMLSIGDLATVNIYVNEAGDALSDISQPSKPKM
ncbi:CBS domain-containing protein [Crassaminicella thermophila]|uniref:CBS domain-containing protein n=1 Tax=Crassaminicella thermophila TaxID=2599308 RepID=A0A5C0SFS5_CRATE|nr:CBS domain-containing protein [Crassaminicella thermophila]QEK11779.1 CBS domain-containing protein [Crassaminicella thermophila]